MLTSFFTKLFIWNMNYENVYCDFSLIQEALHKLHANFMKNLVCLRKY